MISPANAIVQLNGKTYRELKSIEISQSINVHHYFSITIGSEKIGEAANSFLEKAREFVGTDMALEIQSNLREKLVFRGVVTRVRSAATSRSELGHNVIIEGYSPTILLDNGSNCQVYLNKSLKNIAEELCRDFPVNVLNPKISPMKADPIPYTVQYQESAFSFLNRLACRYGEWFYFDGQAMVFGNKQQATVELIYGTDLLSFDIGISVAPLVQSFAVRVYKEDTTQTQNISGQSSSMKGLASFAMNQSAKTFLGKPVEMIHQLDDDSAVGSQMDDIARLTMQAEAARKVTFSGVSIDPGLFPGAIASVNNLTARGKAKQGEYIITSVNHSWSSGGEYQNSFTAIPLDVEVPPMTSPTAVPLCQSQPAVVTDNNDPDSLGRVKIRFSWQKYGDSPWVRIAMPHGGSNKGAYFVPEIGEEVMVGFEGGNAEKPFVQGTLYHSSAAPGAFANEQNNIKAIKTRSGHTIRFNDADGGTSITIEDPGGNSIQFDTKGKNITINAPETMTLNAKNLKINVTEKMTTDVGTDMKTSVGANSTLNITEKHEITSAEAKETVQGDKKITVQGDLAIESSTADYIAKEGDLLIKSAGVATMQGKSDAKVNRG